MNYLIILIIYLVGCAIPVQRDTHLVVSLVLAGQRNSSSQRNLDKSQLSSSSEIFKDSN